jgi:phosphotransferase system enzyme I (PtsI)
MVNQYLQGIGVSPGIAIGRAYVKHGSPLELSGQVVKDEEMAEREVERFQTAVRIAVDEIGVIVASTVLETTAVEVLEVQIELLQDQQLRSDVLEKIRIERKNASDALIEVIQRVSSVFREMDDEYLRLRAADVEDAGVRLLRKLGHIQEEQVPDGEDLILIDHDLSPSDAIALSGSRVIGWATETGGKTSHAAIVARLRGLPAAAGCGAALKAIATGDLLIIDGTSGEVIVHPDANLVESYQQKRAAVQERTVLLRSLKEKEAVTMDGTRIRLLANIGSVADLEQALESGAEGVGLLRTELLFLERDSLPTEEEQLAFYRSVLIRSGGRPVTIRTLDIGGDKPLPYLGLPKEDNPFLGYRAIRICLDKKDLFLTQLRAILRASVFGNCRILLPMISGIDEVRAAHAVLDEARESLSREGQSFADVELGIMIEIPAAAILADQLAKEVDFFSIGTNDLIQYTLAADRMNERVAHLYDPLHPAVLRLVYSVIEQGRLHGKEVGMCGELAGDPQATQLLLGMGLKEFSMNGPSIPAVKEMILKTDRSKLVIRQGW